MTSNDLAFLEDLCNRFVLAQEATGLTRVAFARRVGLSGSQFTNISRYRNPPSHEVLWNASREFGIPVNWFYEGTKFGIRDPELAERLRVLEWRHQRLILIYCPGDNAFNPWRRVRRRFVRSSRFTAARHLFPSGTFPTLPRGE